MFPSDYSYYDAAGNPVAYGYPFEPLVSGDYYLSVQGNSKGSYGLLMTDLADDYAANAATSGKLLPGGAAAAGKFDYDYDIDGFRIPVEEGKAYTVAYPLPPVGAAYTLQASAGGADDHGDNAVHATAAALGQVLKGTLDGGSDTDVIVLQLEAGVTYEVTASGVADGATPTGVPSLVLRDGSGNYPASGSGNVQAGKMFVTAATTGPCYASVYGTSLAYTFTAVAVKDDHGANAVTPGYLPVGGSAGGTLENASDIDELARQPEYVSSSDPRTMAFVPEASGTYYVSTKLPLNWYGKPADYTVTARLGEPDDVGATHATAGTLADSAPAGGRLELPQDTDMFRFKANAGTAYIVELADSNGKTPGISLGWTVEGETPMQNLVRDIGRDYPKPQLFEPLAGGGYYFTVKSYNGASGGYTLRLKPVAGDTIAASKETVAALAP